MTHYVLTRMATSCCHAACVWRVVQVIQRRCKVCGGTGLVQRGRFQRKCPQCGGFFPWRSWKDFLSANARPGNGGERAADRADSQL